MQVSDVYAVTARPLIRSSAPKHHEQIIQIHSWNARTYRDDPAALCPRAGSTVGWLRLKLDTVIEGRLDAVGPRVVMEFPVYGPIVQTLRRYKLARGSAAAFAATRHVLTNDASIGNRTVDATPSRW